MSVYENVGGEEGISKLVVDELYPRIQKHPELAKMFANTDMPKQHRMMTSLVCMAAGGPQKYNGKSMKNAHSGLGITNVQFNLVATALIESMESLNWTDSSKNAILQAVAPMSSDIVEVEEADVVS